MNIDQDLQQYYERQFDLFAHLGWKDLIEDLEELYSAVNDLATVENEATLYFRKGQMDVLNLIFDRKQACENAWKDINGTQNI